MSWRAASAWLFLIFVVASAQSAPSRPNIILILCDDLGYSDIGCYGSEIATPNLDRLASEGLRFTQFYNCAVCVTTRAALTTGLYPRKAWGTLRPNMATLGEVLGDAGYSTGYTGKWRLGHAKAKRPIDRGWEEFYGLLSGCANFFNPGKPDPGFYNGGKIRPFAHNEKTITEFPEDYHMTEAKEKGFEDYNRGIPVGDRRGYEFVGKGWGWAQNAPLIGLLSYE